MAHLTEERVLELKAIARKLRVDILEMITKAASGHTGGSLSCLLYTSPSPRD